MNLDRKLSFTCLLCNCKSESKIHLKSHMTQHVKREEVNLSDKHKDSPGQKFLCVMCNRKYSYIRGISHHLKQHMEGKSTSILRPKLRFSLVKSMMLSGKRFESDKPFQCDLCGQGFSSTSKMRRHYLIHDIQDLFSCDMCEYSTNRFDTLSNHRLTHSLDKNYMCCKCHKMFKTLRSLKSHILHHEGSTLLVCPICSAETMSLAKFKTHLQGHKKDTPEKLLTEPLLQLKDMCQQVISENLFFYPDKKQEEKKPRQSSYTRRRQKTIYLCNICGYMSNRKYNYLVHSLIHSPDKPYKCEYCVYSSKSPSNLCKHRVQCHFPKQSS